jgi:hypothetical protein
VLQNFVSAREMQSLFYIAFALSCSIAAASGPVPTGTVIAGASKVDLEIPVGVPLSGYNHGTRRVPHWPLKEVTDYTSYMMPSKGQLEPSYARALYIQDPSGSAVCYLSCDIIGMDGAATAAAIVLARSHGFPLTDDEVVFGASHSHSTAGAVTSNKLWELAPATDLLVPKLLDSFVQHLAKALVQAYQSAVNATVGIGITQVYNVTDNRRQHESPYVNASSIDPSLTIIRVDDVHGQPIATLWNFATHGTCKCMRARSCHLFRRRSLVRASHSHTLRLWPRKHAAVWRHHGYCLVPNGIIRRWRRAFYQRTRWRPSAATCRLPGRAELRGLQDTV